MGHDLATASKASDAIHETPSRAEATYNIMILPYTELKKDDVKKRIGTATILSLHLDKPFDTFKAQVLQKIDKATSPATLSFENYKAFFTIVRIAPQPTSLADEDDYKEFLKRLRRASIPAATIYIQELSTAKKVRHDFSDSEMHLSHVQCHSTDCSPVQGPAVRQGK